MITKQTCVLALGLAVACGSGSAGPVDIEGPGPAEDEEDVGHNPNFPGEEPEAASSGATTTSSSSSGGGNTSSCSVPQTDCYDCAQDACGAEWNACLADETCCCWTACVGNGGDASSCEDECGPLPAIIAPMQACINASCSSC